DLKGGFLGFPIYSRLHAGTLTQEVKRHGAIMVEQARALKQATNKATKIQYTGIQVLAQATNDLHYEAAEDRAMDIAAAINEDILEVDAMGIDFIQLDEFTWPYFFEPWAIEAFNRAVEGVQHAKIICHVCWGNWGGTPAYYPDETADAGEIFDLTIRKGDEPSATASVVPKAYEANIDVLNLESCGRRSDDLSGLEVIRENPVPEHVQFWAGVIDVKSTITETAEQVAGRIRRLLEHVPANQLGVTTHCRPLIMQRYSATGELHAIVA
ncbi:MAG: 2-hydroxypropyl-CoM lyase, partial [bacterium]|nr:2-hydroxypropyl-CoM lyase [bacterium]